MGVLYDANDASSDVWSKDAFHRLRSYIDGPEKFVAPSSDAQTDLRELVKIIYDNADQSEYGPIPELIVDGVDSEQIWEELELRSVPLIDQMKRRISEEVRSMEQKKRKKSKMEVADEEEEEDGQSERIVEGGDEEDDDEEDEEVAMDSVNDDDEDSSEEDRDDDDDEEDDDDDEDEFDENEEDDVVIKGKSTDQPGLEDEFFSLDAMDKFADQMEDDGDGDGSMNGSNDESKSGDDDSEMDDDDDDQVDLGDSITGSTTAHYNDFFDHSRTNSTALPDQDDADDEFAGVSEFRKHQLKLQKEIKELEERNIGGRPWELMGEAKMSDRPADSLIDAKLDFEMADKQPELITEEVTKTIEELIAQRIRDRSWDDVERKAEPVAKPFKARSELETDKSQIGLAEIYEKEYVAKATGVDDADQELSKEHKEIASIFASLCYKLDALSNFHFTPKAAREEDVIRVNAPAISMEEAIPMAVSLAQTIAPEEIFKGDKVQPASALERTREEKRALRRSHKQKSKKSKAQKAEEDRARAKYDDKFREKKERQSALKLIADGRNNIVKGKTDKDATEYTRSTSFFKNIQESENKRGHKAPRPSATDKPIGPSSISFKL